MIDTIIQGDCLEVMSSIPDKSIDMILCDLPYGTTHNEWDKQLPLWHLWGEYRRIIKPNGAIILTSQQPFTSELVVSGKDIFRYELIWAKTMGVGFLNANKMPLRSHENILVFYKNLPAYNPQMVEGKPYQKYRKSGAQGSSYGYADSKNTENTGERFPKSWIIVSNGNNKNHNHPTQKPVALFEYLIKTYTNEGDLVLDNCIGSGTTAIACKNTGRHFIGIEKELEYCQIAERRLSQLPQTLNECLDKITVRGC
jgi:site-specific DNA-methyltransferase (adenine-specific)